MDATENDLPPSAGFSVSSFPTIKFKRAGTKEFIDYEGDRSLESLIEFVEQKASNTLVVAEPKPSAVTEPEATAEATPAAEATSAEPSATPAAVEHDEL